MQQRRARPVFRFRPFNHASSRRLSRKRLGSIEKAVLSPPTGPQLAGTHEAVLSPPTGPLATGPLAGAQEAVLSPPTGPLAGRHLFRVISFATAFHNLIRDQKSPERGPPRTLSECLTLLSEPGKQVCEAASSTPCLPLSNLQQRFKPPAVTETPRKHRKSRSLTSHESSGWYTRSRSLTSHGSSGHGSSGWCTRSRSLTSHGSSGW